MPIPIDNTRASDIIWRCFIDIDSLSLDPRECSAAHIIERLRKDNNYDAVISFIAACLFGSEAVWWGCRCVSVAVAGNDNNARLASMLKWVRDNRYGIAGKKMPPDENADPLSWLEFAIMLPQTMIIDYKQAITLSENAEGVDPFAASIAGSVKLSAVRASSDSKGKLDEQALPEWYNKVIRIGLDVLDGKDGWE